MTDRPTGETHGVPQEKRGALTLAQARASVIDSVLKNGLKTWYVLEREKAEYVGSGDKRFHHKKPNVEGQGLQGEINDATLHEKLYGHERSPIIVLTERDYEDLSPLEGEPTEEKLRKAEERIKSSFIIIYKMQQSPTVEPKQFQYVIFPDDIYNEYLEVKKMSPQINLPIVIAKGEITRRMWNEIRIPDRMVSVPDYETPIKEIARKDGRSLMIHAVRLPTQGDLQRSTAVRREGD